MARLHKNNLKSNKLKNDKKIIFPHRCNALHNKYVLDNNFLCIVNQVFVFGLKIKRT